MLGAHTLRVVLDGFFLALYRPLSLVVPLQATHPRVRLVESIFWGLRLLQGLGMSFIRDLFPGILAGKIQKRKSHWY